MKLKTYEFVVEEVRVVKKKYYIDEYDYKTALQKAKDGNYDEVTDEGEYQYLKQNPKIISGKRIIFND